MWFSEPVDSGIAVDRRRSLETIECLTRLRDDAADGEYTGFATVAYRKDGGIDLIAAGRGVSAPASTIGHLKRLIALLSALKGNVNDYLEGMD